MSTGLLRNTGKCLFANYYTVGLCNNHMLGYAYGLPQFICRFLDSTGFRGFPQYLLSNIGNGVSPFLCS